MKALIIFYVKEQDRSRLFYEHVLGRPPSLNVPGMTEFELDGCHLGLMPEAGIKRLLGDALPDPAQASGIPRSELYLRVSNPNAYHQRAVAGGAKELSTLQLRGWGESVAYCLDPDGHVLAFAAG